MRSRSVAAEMAAAAGIPTVIAGGKGEVVLAPILTGEPRGTRFPAGDARLPAFKLWLRFGKPAAARLHVDAGAHRALLDGGASLLAVGVARTEGRFEVGDAVELVGPDGAVFGKGIAGVDAAGVDGRPRGVEAVHRDRLVLDERAWPLLPTPAAPRRPPARGRCSATVLVEQEGEELLARRGADPAARARRAANGDAAAGAELTTVVGALDLRRAGARAARVRALLPAREPRRAAPPPAPAARGRARGGVARASRSRDAFGAARAAGSRTTSWRDAAAGVRSSSC